MSSVNELEQAGFSDIYLEHPASIKLSYQDQLIAIKNDPTMDQDEKNQRILELGLISTLTESNDFTIQDRDVVLILTTTADDNDSYTYISPPTLLALDQMKMAQKNTSVLYKYVSSVEDIFSTIQQLKSQNNRIRTVWIKAHGDRHNIYLGKGKTEVLYQLPFFGNVCELKPSLDLLDEDASIILDSCATGIHPNSYFPNIAQMIASLAPGKTVISAARMIKEEFETVVSFEKNSRGKLDMRFMDENNADITARYISNGDEKFLPYTVLSPATKDFALAIGSIAMSYAFYGIKNYLGF